MDTPFVYDRYVTGKNFIGRKTECNILGNLLEAGEQIVIYEPPKSGKMSVVQQTLYNMRSAGKQFAVAWVNLFNVRTLEDFLIKFGVAVMKLSASTPEEYASIVETYLDDTHFVFDRVRFINTGEVLSLNWQPDENDIARLMQLPQKLALAKGIRYVVVLKEFQNLMNADEYETVFKIMETQMKERDRNAP